MRLIDADALIEFCEERWIPLNINAVNMQPTIQPEKAQLSSEGTTSDLIDRRAVIDALQKEIDKGIPPFDDVIASIRCGVRLARNIIEDLPSARPEPQWIPVSERLPEIGGEYLVSVRWYREDDIDINVYDYDARCKEWNDGESCGQRVIAWMPLPKPFEGGTE